MQVSRPLVFGAPLAPGPDKTPAPYDGGGRGPGAPTAEPLYSLHPLRIWRFLQTQPVYFWAICIYAFFEYVRPQQIYTWMLFFPWTQAAILVALVGAVMGSVRFRLATPIDHLLSVFSGVVLLSCLTAQWPEVSLGKVGPIYFTWVLIYLLISNIVTTERRFIVFILGFLLYSFKMSQHGTRSWAMAGFAFQGHGVTGAPGWFQNSGEFGVQMAIFVPIVGYFTVALRPHLGKKMLLFCYLMMLTAIIGTIGSSSRGAMIAVAAVVLFMVLKSRHKMKALMIVAVLALFTNFMLPPESRARFEAIGDDEDRTSVSRQNYWNFGVKVIGEYPVLGIGFANWPEYYKKFHGYEALPHNIFIEVAAELGYAGFVVFLGLITATFVVNHRTRKMVVPLEDRGKFVASMAHGLDAALIGFLVAGQFVTVTYYPFFWINLAMTVALHNTAQDLIARAGHRGVAIGARASRRRPALPLASASRPV